MINDRAGFGIQPEAKEGQRHEMKWRVIIVVAAFAIIAIVTEPIWHPRLFFGTPRNQPIRFDFVEHNIRLGMTQKQVSSVLGISVATMNACSRRTKNGETEVEIAGSSPPWRELRSEFHSVVLRFDKDWHVSGGYGIWYDGDNTDMDALQLER